MRYLLFLKKQICTLFYMAIISVYFLFSEFFVEILKEYSQKKCAK